MIDMLPFPRMPSALSTTFLIMGFLALGVILLPDYGMGWDEITRWQSGDAKIAYYELLLAGEEPPSLKGDRYPGLFDMTLSLVHQRIRGDRMIQGHALSLLFAALGLAATAWLGALVFNGRTAFLSTLFLVLYPNFFGHAFINPKDIPFMATFTLGLAAVIDIGRRILEKRPAGWGRFLLAGLCIGLAASSRLPGLVLIGYAAVGWLGATWLASSSTSQWPVRELTATAMRLGIASLAALLLLILFFPRLHSQLFSGVSQVAQALHGSARDIPLLFRGQVMSAGDGPASYAHQFFLISTPLWMLVLLAVGAARFLSVLRRPDGTAFSKRLVLAYFGAAAAFPWLYILLSQPALHNGIRHLLWAVPPLIVLMAYGFESLSENVRLPPRLRLLPPLALAGLIAWQTVQLARLHPYQYVSFNRLAGPTSTLLDRFEGEYWFTSTRHLLEALPAVAAAEGFTPSAQSPVTLRISGPLQAAYPFVPTGFRLVDSFAEADFYLSNTTFRADLFAEGRVVHQVQRGGLTIGIIKRLR